MAVLAFAEGSAIQLVPDGTIIIHIALILLMIYILNRTFFGPINRVIEARERKSGGGLSEAEEILSTVREKNVQYEAALRGARSEGYQLIEAERLAAVADKESRVGSVREETAAKLAAEKESVAKQTEAARARLAAEAQTMAERISTSILKQS
jgi:F0F1-type ATP synthase membrane subunit b/b'